MSAQELAFTLESHIVTDYERILLEAPVGAIMAWRTDQAERVPSAFAFYKDKWYTVWSAGQGPGIGYFEP
jgi:hypothetical protein